MYLRYQTSRLVQWHDTDAAGIAHFTAFFRYMEEAEHELLRARGLSVSMQREGEHLSWPRVSVRCDYSSPVKFEDEVDVLVRIGRIGKRSITYAFDFACRGREVAHGEITAVCCRITEQGLPESIDIPEWVLDRLKGNGES